MNKFSWKVIFWSIITVATVWACSPKNKIASAPLEDAILWEISHPNLSEKSYLLGTVHYIPSKYYVWPDLFEEKFQATEQLVLEMNIQDFQVGDMMGLLEKAIMKDDQSIGDFVTPEEYQSVSSYFSDMGLPFILLERLKPFFLYTIVSTDFQSMDTDNFKSYELELGKKSTSANMEVVGLETVDYQISIFDSIPYQLQADMLVQAVAEKNTDSNNSQGLIELYETYQRQDITDLYNMVIDQDSTMLQYNNLLIDNRNRNWIPKIQALIADKSTFIAVGAGHLGGPNGLIYLLTKEGYTLKPIITDSNGSH